MLLAGTVGGPGRQLSLQLQLQLPAAGLARSSSLVATMATDTGEPRVQTLLAPVSARKKQRAITLPSCMSSISSGEKIKGFLALVIFTDL